MMFVKARVKSLLVDVNLMSRMGPRSYLQILYSLVQSHRGIKIFLIASSNADSTAEVSWSFAQFH